MKKAKKKVLKGKNKFIRLDDDNLKFILKQSKEHKRSQNWVINQVIHDARSILK
jgi:hypothetical protein